MKTTCISSGTSMQNWASGFLAMTPKTLWWCQTKIWERAQKCRKSHVKSWQLLKPTLNQWYFQDQVLFTSSRHSRCNIGFKSEKVILPLKWGHPPTFKVTPCYNTLHMWSRNGHYYKHYYKQLHALTHCTCDPKMDIKQLHAVTHCTCDPETDITINNSTL